MWGVVAPVISLNILSPSARFSCGEWPPFAHGGSWRMPAPAMCTHNRSELVSSAAGSRETYTWLEVAICH